MLARVSSLGALCCGAVLVALAAVAAVVVWVLESRVVAPVAVCGGDFAMGNDKPRSFPRLATPTPQVKVVRYPEHSFPSSMHWPQ
jgi:hypothetical protein